MTLIIACIFWLLGGVIGSFGVIQLMIVLFFGIPFTNKLKKLGLITNARTIYKKSIITIAILTIEVGGVSILVYIYASQLSLIFYLIGICITFILGFRQTGTNDNNLQDYFKKNYRLINIDGLENVDEEFGTIILDYFERVLKEKGISF